MKTPLNYQQSEYDCVPVTFLNAMSYLCNRDEINPELIKTIYNYSMDSCDKYGNPGKRGTSEKAVELLVRWLNEYSRKVSFNIYCEFLLPLEITLENALIASVVTGGGVLLACVHFSGSYHYVLVTRIDESFVYLFDPYYMTVNTMEDEYDFIIDQPLSMNRRVRKEVFFGFESRPYALGEIAKREGVLIYRTL